MVKSDGSSDRRRSLLIPSILFLAIFLLSGCDKIRQLANDSQIIKKQQEEITGLDKKIHDLDSRLVAVKRELESQHLDNEQKLTALGSSFDSLSTKYAALDSNVNMYNKYVMHDNSNAAQRLDTNFGSMFVSLNGITSDNSAAHLSLNIGNPYTYTVSGFTLHVRYGVPFNPSGAESYENWRSSLKSANESFHEQLQPGQWNKIDVSLGKSQPADIKYVSIEMTIDDIKLSEQQKTTRSPGHAGAAKHSPETSGKKGGPAR